MGVREEGSLDPLADRLRKMAQLILRAFGLKIVAPPEEVQNYVRGIDREGVTEAQIGSWIRRRAEPLR